MGEGVNEQEGRSHPPGAILYQRFMCVDVTEGEAEGQRLKHYGWL